MKFTGIASRIWEKNFCIKNCTWCTYWEIVISLTKIQEQVILSRDFVIDENFMMTKYFIIVIFVISVRSKVMLFFL